MGNEGKTHFLTLQEGKSNNLFEPQLLAHARSIFKTKQVQEKQLDRWSGMTRNVFHF